MGRRGGKCAGMTETGVGLARRRPPVTARAAAANGELHYDPIPAPCAIDAMRPVGALGYGARVQQAAGLRARGGEDALIRYVDGVWQAVVEPSVRMNGDC